MVVGHLASGNFSVVVGIEVVEDRLGMFGRGLVGVIGRGTGLGSGCGFGGCGCSGRGISGRTFRNRWRCHRFGWLVLFAVNSRCQQHRASGDYQHDRTSHESVS